MSSLTARGTDANKPRWAVISPICRPFLRLGPSPELINGNIGRSREFVGQVGESI